MVCRRQAGTYNAVFLSLDDCIVSTTTYVYSLLRTREYILLAGVVVASDWNSLIDIVRSFVSFKDEAKCRALHKTTRVRQQHADTMDVFRILSIDEETFNTC